MKNLWSKFISFLNERGFDKIPNSAKHFMGSLILVLLFYGIPLQILGLAWNLPIQLFISAAISWGIGIWYEFRIAGNQSHKDIWTDFAGILTAVLLCLL